MGIVLHASSLLFDLRVIRRRLADVSTGLFSQDHWILDHLDDMIEAIENGSETLRRAQACPAQEARVGKVGCDRHGDESCSSCA